MMYVVTIDKALSYYDSKYHKWWVLSENVLEWFKENDIWYDGVYSDAVTFQDANDAMAFKLRWS